MDLVDQRDEVVAEQEDMQALIDRKDTFDAIIANQQFFVKKVRRRAIMTCWKTGRWMN